jgi:hypothetical protein
MKSSICKLLICVVALWAFSMQELSAQMVAVITDAVKDLMLTPNVGVDLVVGEKYTLGAEVAFNRNPWGIQMQMTSVTPEFRYWFNGRPLTRQYVGIVANMTGYKLAWKNVHHGDAIGLGISFGHVWTLTQRWNIDLTGSLGVIGYREKFYRDYDDFADYGERANARGYALLPIKLGVSVVYVIR